MSPRKPDGSTPPDPRTRRPALVEWREVPGSRMRRAHYRDPDSGYEYQYARPWDYRPAWDVVLDNRIGGAILGTEARRCLVKQSSSNLALYQSPFEQYSLEPVLALVVRRTRRRCQAAAARWDSAAGSRLLREEIETALGRWTEAEWEAEWILEGLDER